MSVDLRDLVARASTFGLLLSTDGEHLRVESVTGQPVPAALRVELAGVAAELVAYLRWRDEATDLLCASMRRLEGHYCIGCPVDTPEWRVADAAVTEAFWSGDAAKLRGVLAEYEAFALRNFERYSLDLERRGEPG